MERTKHHNIRKGSVGEKEKISVEEECMLNPRFHLIRGRLGPTNIGAVPPPVSHLVRGSILKRKRENWLDLTIMSEMTWPALIRLESGTQLWRM